MSRYIALVMAWWVATVASADPPSLRQSDLRTVTVDADVSVGTLHPLLGVDGAPGPGGHKPLYFKFGGWNMKDTVDASAGYRRAHIELVRTHDGYGPGDIDSRFESASAPGGGLISAKRDVLTLFPDPNADPDNRPPATASAPPTSSSPPLA